MKDTSIQWKVAFLNANIKKENLERFILKLKVGGLYDELADEIEEFLEFENFYLISEKLKSELLSAEDAQLFRYEYKPCKHLIFNLSSKKGRILFYLVVLMDKMTLL
jgi:hypothetical protein